MLSINSTPVRSIRTNNHNVNFSSEHSSSGSSNNSGALRNSLMALAVLAGMTGWSDDFEENYSNSHAQKKIEYTAQKDSINSRRSIDEYMQDLGFLQDGKKLGDVNTLYFEDLNGTKHYLEKGDSTLLVGKPNGIQFHGVDIDKNGNKQEYNMKFEKYHQGLIVTKDSINPNYKEGGVDTTRYVASNGKVIERTKLSTPRDTVTYRFNAQPDGSYMVQKAEGKGIIFYCPIAEVHKTNAGLLFEGYDWVNERKTNDIQILSNFQNDVAMPKEEE